jgi:hypothetical protein
MIIPTHVPERTPSLRAQELGQRLALVIAEYQQNHPEVSGEEIRVATEIAAGQVSAPRRPAAGALAAAVAAAAALGAFLFFQRGSPAGAHVPWIAVAVGAVALAAVVAALRNRS